MQAGGYNNLTVPRTSVNPPPPPNHTPNSYMHAAIVIATLSQETIVVGGGEGGRACNLVSFLVMKFVFIYI